MQAQHIHYSLKQLLLLLAVTTTGFMLAVITGIPLVIGIIPGLATLFIQLRLKGIGIRSIVITAKKGVDRTKEIIWLLGLVSILIPAWMMSDTVPQMIRLILSLIQIDHFLLLSFLVTALVSMMLGTAVGSLSVIGIPLISTAAAIGIPLEWTAGALVSGAFVGDRSSPFSSAFLLLSHTLELPPERQLRKIMPTLIVGVIASALFFGWLDTKISPAAVHHAIGSHGVFMPASLIAFLPPLLLIAGVILRIRIRYAFIVSIASAAAIAFFIGSDLVDWLGGAWSGVSGLGGLQHMLLLLLFLAMVGIYNELLEEHRIIQPFIDRMLTNTESIKRNTVQTVGLAIGVAAIAPNQSFPIVLAGRTLLPHWRSHFDAGELARILSDSSMLFAGLVPWSLLAIMCSALLRVNVIHYAPFAAFLWMMPFITIAYSVVTDTASSRARRNGIKKMI